MIEAKDMRADSTEEYGIKKYRELTRFEREKIKELEKDE